MWKDIMNCSNYEVSSNGEVRNKTTKHILKNYIMPNGYCQVSIKMNGDTKFIKKSAINIKIVDSIAAWVVEFPTSLAPPLVSYPWVAQTSAINIPKILSVEMLEKVTHEENGRGWFDRTLGKRV